jgi:hypothetical protein
MAFVGTHVEVVRMHVLAGRDRLACEADDLVVAAHRLALGDGAHRDLVAGRDQAARRHALDRRAADQLAARDHDIVGGMESNEGVHRGVLV